jgi:hypothetical protein
MLKFHYIPCCVSCRKGLISEYLVNPKHVTNASYRECKLCATENISIFSRLLFFTAADVFITTTATPTHSKWDLPAT